MTSKIQLRRDTALNWTNSTAILAQGEPGFETDTNKFKIGDGTTVWASLNYAGGGGVGIGTDGQIAIGDGTTDQGDTNSIAIGTDAGIEQSTATIAIGHEAGKTNQDRSAVAIGRSAGESDQGRSAVAIGRYAGAYDQSSQAIAIGYYAGNDDQQDDSIAIGSGAGTDNQGYEAVAVGAYSGNDNQGQHAVAVGYEAGNYEQGIAAVAIGEEAGNDHQGFRAIAIGRWAGYQGQGDQAVAIGALAGRKEQKDYAVAVGYHAGQGYQGSSAVAIGKDAGRGVNLDTANNNSGGDYPTVNWVSGGASGTTTFIVDNVTNIFPGMQAIGTNLNNCYVTAINTQTKEITISPGTSGDLEGNTPTISFYGYQGANAIAIGAYAGASVQHPNSVIINASGTEVNSAGTGTLVVQSLRQVSGGTIPTGFYQVAWNPTTGEMIAITP